MLQYCKYSEVLFFWPSLLVKWGQSAICNWDIMLYRTCSGLVLFGIDALVLLVIVF